MRGTSSQPTLGEVLGKMRALEPEGEAREEE